LNPQKAPSTRDFFQAGNSDGLPTSLRSC
jgi:hypothetical protein